ncbi:TPA: hypothetical protein JBG74_13140 [Legionella pneumophila]|uniref:Uncharacterized protein n=2 Tax=Legionella pneumophila TaxID=446 RepID=Q5ZSL4_LEGPH|nr:hypothetical protein [Legionella pneumophila]WBV63592.1 hypothetical protein PGH43_01730 [Legionella pneumophila 130b]AAU28563.1 hypothetical protein lpg2503 [Legionella pneumophila subsp. pneumophila str. Philadelphia 1]AEW52740.1 hypothetical protein lp12_2496 [Legionella pneumophila subsp. pneumophila ATCC 43290]AGH52643.1 Malonyl CoA-acyl carrier protein transacylase [Legionella pneumophila subsp. pneumophila LPE509]AOU05498.1 hypothetical protein A9E97_12605 [Legionella pneumophila]
MKPLSRKLGYWEELCQWRTILIYDQHGNSHEILLIAGHNIGDGVSVAYFFHTLFRIYHKSDSNPSLPLYPPVEELVQHKKGKNLLCLLHFCLLRFITRIMSLLASE